MIKFFLTIIIGLSLFSMISPTTISKYAAPLSGLHTESHKLFGPGVEVVKNIFNVAVERSIESSKTTTSSTTQNK